MAQYLLATHGGASETSDDAAPRSPEAMREMMQRIVALEADMESSGTFVFGGHLHGPDAATVVRMGGSDALLTDGPYIESKEYLAGFYIIDSADLDEALGWAARVSECIERPIEVRPFAGTGRAADQMPSAD